MLTALIFHIAGLNLSLGMWRYLWPCLRWCNQCKICVIRDLFNADGDPCIVNPPFQLAGMSMFTQRVRQQMCSRGEASFEAENRYYPRTKVLLSSGSKDSDRFKHT